MAKKQKAHTGRQETEKLATGIKVQETTLTAALPTPVQFSRKRLRKTTKMTFFHGHL